jgi:hypothetical protein
MVADKFRKEEKQLKATTSSGLLTIGKLMVKHAVSITRLIMDYKVQKCQYQCFGENHF